MNKSVKLGNYIIENFSKPYFIAEVSANHLHKIENAFKVIKEASLAGADAIKLQTYTADTMTLNSNEAAFQINKGTWEGENLYDLYKKAYTPWEWHDKLFKYAKSLKLDYFSTPFDDTAVDFLEKLKVPFYKVASFEMDHFPLLEKIALTRKPIIVSTGMSSMIDIKKTVDFLIKKNVKDIILLHCVSGYPTPLSQSKLFKFNILKENFSCPIGFSDHVLTNEASISAITLGACIIEKHLTLDRSLGGPDATFSLEPKELKKLISTGRDIWEALQISDLKKDVEKENLIFKRSIFCVKDIKKGDILSRENIKVLRPGIGLKPIDYYDVLGCRAEKNIKKGTPLFWKHVTKKLL